MLCCVKVPFCAKHFWQISHWCGFSLVWDRICKIFLTILTLIWFHYAGVTPSVLSSVWWLFCLKVFWQYSHWCGFSLVWDQMCSAINDPFVKNISDNIHTDVFFFVVTVLCQSTLLCKTFLTIFTLMWFLVGVRLNMQCKVTIPCKIFLTMLTLIWFHSAGVPPSVL